MKAYEQIENYRARADVLEHVYMLIENLQEENIRYLEVMKEEGETEWRMETINKNTMRINAYKELTKKL